MRQKRTIADRFWAKVQKTDACWTWTATRNERGYGLFAIRTGQMRKAHRLAYELSVGPIPKGLFVCHHCDNPPCVNPAHLFVGTNSDNMRDALNKGRLNLSNLFGRSTPRTHCSRGHALTDGNVYVSGRWRRCRTCKLAQVRHRTGSVAPRGQQTECRRGHAFTDENTLVQHIDGRTQRSCRACKNLRYIARRAASLQQSA